MISLLSILLCVGPAPAAAQDSPHGVLTFNVIDLKGDAIQARLTFVDSIGKNRELFPNPDADPTKLALRKHAVYTLEGHGSITVPVGSWDVMASHGIEWSIDTTHFDVVEGGEY